MSKKADQPFKFKRRKKGVCVIDLAREYNRNTSTIYSIQKDKEKLKAATVSKGVSRQSDKRSQAMDDVERLLLVWIDEKRLQGETVTQPIICEKAKRIFNELVEKMPLPSNGKVEAFKASNGWFERFKQRTGIQS
ncbi:tigger transposable element-derived protein 2-like [Anopheles maculipalpis]|uniref:tigger transposable element-derived protein 2-like n=1 Tax=Anopheles maculipalpis TaxID=1496333 RepID=UPI002158F0ED|nr:tigger transposable element-derived protein 2-like [Anopheles maculipalpis]